MSEKKKDTRTRNYATVVYPESAPENWMDLLADQFVPAFISPLHDQDINSDGEPKKPHYHVMIMFDGPKSVDQVKTIFDQIGGVGLEIVKVLRSYARYLCHMDNPDKHQYSTSDIRALGGADYHSVIGLAIDKYIAIGEMIDFCEQNDIVSYRQLLVWSRDNKFEWFRVLCDSATLVMKEYLKAKQWGDSNSALERKAAIFNEDE